MRERQEKREREELEKKERKGKKEAERRKREDERKKREEERKKSEMEKEMAKEEKVTIRQNYDYSQPNTVFCCRPARKRRDSWGSSQSCLKDHQLKGYIQQHQWLHILSPPPIFMKERDPLILQLILATQPPPSLSLSPLHRVMCSVS